MKLLRATECSSRDATAVSRCTWLLVRAASSRKVVMTDLFFRGTAVEFMIPILSLTVADVDSMSCRNSMPFPIVFRFLLFLIADPLNIADLTFSSRRLYEDFFHCFAFVGGLLTIFG